MSSTSFYPSLSTILPTENIPDELGEFREGLDNIFSKIFYKDLQIDQSVNGDSAFYSLSIVTKKISLEIPGTGGLALLINPDDSISSFPVTLSYKWGVLKYYKDFDLQGFNFSGEMFFDLILNIAGVSKSELLAEAIGIFIDEPDPIQAFIDDFNINYSPLPSTAFTKLNDPDEILIIEDLINQFNSGGNNYDVYAIVLGYFLQGTNSFGDIFDKLSLLFSRWLGYFTIDDIKELLTPQVSTSINVNFGIQLPSSLFRQVDEFGEPILDVNNNNEELPVIFLCPSTTINYSTKTGLEIENNFSLSTVNYAEIKALGLYFKIQNFKLDLSRTKNIPEAIADGRPENFVGVYIQQAEIFLPKKWFADPDGTETLPGTTAPPPAGPSITAENLLVGTGGISGKISFDSNGLLYKKLGNFWVELDEFSLEFQQNSIKDCSITGNLYITNFKNASGGPAKINISVTFDDEGNFKITASEQQGIEIKIPDVISFIVKSLTIGINAEDDEFYIAVEGSMKFINPFLMTVISDPLEIKKLLIWNDGRIEFEGGTIPLPKSVSIKAGPAKIAITAIHFGSHEKEGPNGSGQLVPRKYRYWGFDGGVNVNPGGVDVQGKGVKFFYTIDSHPITQGSTLPPDAYLRIDSIEVNIIIPGDAQGDNATAIIKGFLGMKDVAGSTETEYIGGIELMLPKLKMSGGAAMRLRPRTPAFLIDVWLEMAVPIVLGATGLGIFGFRGLLGVRYVATKEAAGVPDGSWFDYYKAPPQEGVNVFKFEGPSETKDYGNPFSIGAGLSLATASDSGQTFSMKLFVLLSLPSVLYLEGKANVLSERVGLIGDDPMFFAYIALTSDSVETGFGADYKIPKDSGSVLALYAEAQAGYFFQDSSAWYINFGTKEKPITARILSLFDATSYLMFSATGIETGARVSYEFNKTYAGVVKAYVNVYMEIGGWVSFARPQIGGYIGLGGTVDVSLFGIGFYLSLITSLSVEVPKPFIIKGAVDLCVAVKILFKTIEKCFTVRFIWERTLIADTTAINLLPQVSIVPSQPPFATNAKGVNIHSQETFNILYFNSVPGSAQINTDYNHAIIPLDTFIDIELIKGVIPNAVSDKIGGVTNAAEGYIDLVPPQPTAHRVTHSYQIDEFEIKIRHNGSWIDYHPYEAMSTPDALTILDSNPSEYKFGYWQKTGGKYNKIRLLSQTPLNYVNQGAPGWSIPEQFGMTSGSMFCQTTSRQRKCVNWNNTGSTLYYLPNRLYIEQGLLFKIVNTNGSVLSFANIFGIPKSLCFHNQDGIFEMYLPEPSLDVEIKLFTYSSGVIIKYYKEVTNGSSISYQLIRTENKNRYSLLSPVTYLSTTDAIKKMTIEPLSGDINRINQLSSEIEDLSEYLYENPKLNIREITRIKNLISQKQAEIEKERSIGCIGKESEPDTIRKLIKYYTNELKKCRGESIPLSDRLKTLKENLNTTIIKKYASVKDYIKLFTDKHHKFPSPAGKIDINKDNAIGRIEQYETIKDNINSILILRNKLSKKCEEIEILLKDLYNALKLMDKYRRPEGEVGCSTFIHQICWISVIDSQFNSIIPLQNAIQADYESMVGAIKNTLSPIWRPESQYYIHLKLTDIVNGNPTGSQDMYFGFETAGPLGHFHTDTRVTYGDNSEDNPDMFSLSYLKSYIDFNKSYPEASGNLIDEKPLFYEDARLLLFYNERYVYHMFEGWPGYQNMPTLSGSLEVEVKDPAEGSTVSFNTPQVEISWIDESVIPASDGVFQQDVSLINNLIDPVNESSDFTSCVITNGTPITPPRLYTEIIITYLKPLKLYTAIFSNNYKGTSNEVFKYGFRTSRYPTFNAQINSYRLEDKTGNTRNAVFNLEFNLTSSDIDLAFNIVNNQADPQISNLAFRYADPFEQLILGALKIPMLPPPVSNEFNIIKNTVTQNIIALWIRNPEPFNRPKIPDSELINTISILSGGSPDGTYHCLFSKDRKNCFIMNDAKNIPPGDFIFRFTYLEWNGYNYTRSEVDTDIIPVN